MIGEERKRKRCERERERERLPCIPKPAQKFYSGVFCEI
jgi:hypothetical protein